MSDAGSGAIINNDPSAGGNHNIVVAEESLATAPKCFHNRRAGPHIISRATWTELALTINEAAVGDEEGHLMNGIGLEMTVSSKKTGYSSGIAPDGRKGWGTIYAEAQK